jgi:uncharacterized protein YbjT (DUF2867 family)
MRVAVIGGTGLTGRHTVSALRRAGHEAVAVSRSCNVDVLSGAGLDAVLAGADAVIDVLNFPAADAAAARDLFGTATKNLLAAEQRAGVRHHVLLSIVGVERLPGNPHYHGKREQEELLAASRVPVTIQRATQFHEFAGMLLDRSTQGGTAYLPPLLLQPVAASDVGEVLAQLVVGVPQGRARDLAGPEPQDLIDMARRTLAARGQTLRLVPTWRLGAFGVEAAGEAFLPGPDAQLAPTTFDAWLVHQSGGVSHGPPTGK